MENLIWINVNEKLLNGINLTNKNISDETFILMLEYISKTINSDNTDNTNETILKDIKSSCNLTNQELSFILKTVTFVFKRSINFLMKPTKLQQDLKNILKFDENKTDAFMKLWINITKPILDDLGGDDGNNNTLENITWKLKVQLSSGGKKKEKTTLGQIDFHTKNSNFNCEMNHVELLNLYEELENVQTELDLLKTK